MKKSLLVLLALLLWSFTSFGQSATHLNFDGSNDFVSVPNSASLAFGTNNLTLEAMVKMNNTQGNYSGIISKAISTNPLVGIQLVVVNNKLALEFGGGTLYGVASGLIGTTNLNDNNWHHVACVVDRANNNIKLYVDGVAEANITNAAFGTANITTTTPLYIGASRGVIELLESNVDEVRVWNVARTQAQITGSKNCELQGSESGLVAYYKFNQGNGAVNNSTVTSLTDASSNANNGTLTNFTLNGATSNWLSGSPVTTGSIIPTVATVTTPVVYSQGVSATALTATTGANGTGLLWYTTATGGTGSATAPTPSTTTVGNTSYWVSSTNANGCESARSEIVVTVSLPATHLNFDGSNDVVSVPATTINNLSQGTIETWIKPAALLNQTIFAKQYNGVGSMAIFGIGIGTATSGKIFYTSKYAGVITSTTNLSINTWYHLAVTFNNTQAKIYINGVLDATVSGDFTIPNYTTVTATSIGAWLGDGGGKYFTGNIDEFRIWNTALPQDDIIRRKNCELQGNESGLIAYYKFNQGIDAATNSAITTLNDAVVSPHNGTLSNFALTGATSNWLAGSPVTTGNVVPTAPTASAQSFCGATTVASLVPAESATINWYNVATGGSALLSSTALATGTYYVTAVNANGCESGRTAVSITINAIPATPTATAQSFCGATTVASLVPAESATINWYNVATGGAALLSSTTLATGTYYVTAVNATGCESARTAVSVTINAIPGAPSAAAQTFCGAKTVANLVTAGTAPKWYNVATGGAALLTSTAIATGTYYVSQTVNTCESARTAVNVTVNAIPPAPTGTAAQQFCTSGTVASLTATGTGINWYAAASGGAILATSLSLVSGTHYYASQTISGCESTTRFDVTVTINAIPAAPTAINPQVYAGTGTIANLIATGTGIQWYAAATGGTALATSTDLVDGTTYYASQIVNSCESTRTPVTVKKISEGTQTLCTPATVANLVSTPSSGTTAQWFTVASGGAALAGTTALTSGTYYIEQTTAAGVVSTLAGSGAQGAADGTGTAARFNTPTGVAVDVAGNVYVVDQFNNKIRKITAAGVVSTLAGSGAQGAADGTGTAASFNYPNGVAVDAAGNVYVADYNNHKIRKITAAGVVSTLAGSGSASATDGTGTAASFNNPSGVAVDAAGNVYVADTYNHKIRKITAAGVVSTWAGSGSAGATDGTGTAASFNYPNGVAVDAAGNVYVADTHNHKIRKITAAGVVSTLAGSGSAGAADGTGTAASFNTPTGVAVDAAGNVYVVDQFNNKIRKITAAGVVSTLAGSGSAGAANGTGTAASFNYPFGVAVDAAGNVYVGDTYNHKLRKITTGSLSNRVAVAVAVNTTAAPAASAQTFCTSTTVADLVATGTALQWYNLATGGTALATSTALATGTYYVSQTLNGCESARTAVSVTIITAPTVSSPINYCTGNVATALTATGSNLLWYTTATGGIGSTTAPTPNTSSLATIPYWVTQTVNGCESARAQIVININECVTENVNGGDLCFGGFGFMLNNPNCQMNVRISGSWFSNGTNSGFYLNGFPYSVTTSGGSGTIEYTIPKSSLPITYLNGSFNLSGGTFCHGQVLLYVESISTVPPPSVANVTYCQNATADPLTAIGNNLTWYTSSSGGTALGAAPTPSTATAGLTTYWVSQTFNCNNPLESSRAQIDVLIQGVPLAPIVSNVSYCQDAIASPLTAVGTNLKWYDAATGGNEIPTPTPLTTTLGTTSYWVSQTNCFESPRAKIDVIINAIPTAPVATAQSFCGSGTVANLVATGTATKWYSVATGGAALTNTIALITGTYYVSQTLNSCESPRTSVVVTVNPLPTTPVVISPINYLQGATATALTATGTSQMWYTTATGGTGSTTSPTPNTTTIGTTSYWVTQNNGTCESPRAKIDVIVSGLATHLNFDGNNDYVMVTNPFNTFTNQITVEAWVKPSGTAGATLISQATPGTDSWAISNQFLLLINGGNTLTFSINNNGSWINCNSSTSLSANTWSHVVGVSNITGTYIYINGVLRGSTSGTSLIKNNSNAQLYIGKDVRYPAWTSFNGSIDEIHIWNTALTATEINNRKDCELKGNETGLVEYYKFNQGIGSIANPTVTTLIDASTNSKNGTLTNFTLNGTTSNWLAGSPIITLNTPIASTQSFCSNATVADLVAIGTALKWYNVAVGGAALATSSALVTGTYYVSQTIGSCESARTAVTINVSQAPAAAAQTFCGSFTVADLVATGTALQWYDAATGGTALALTTALATGTYYVSQTLNSCESVRTAVSVTVNTIPAVPTAASPQVYAGTATIANLTSTGTGIQWYAVASGGTALASTTALVDGTTYYASQTISSCESTTRVAVTVRKISEATQTFCNSATVANLVSTPTSSATAQWFTSSSGGTAMLSTDALSTGTYYVEQGTIAGVTTLGSGFNQPYGVTVEADGKILVVDTGNNAIKRMNPDGTGIVTLGSGFNQPRGIAVQADGKILIADTFNNEIKRMNADGTGIVSLGSGFYSPRGVAVQSDGKIVLTNTDYYNDIIRMNADGTGMETLGSPNTDIPTGISIQTNGKIVTAVYYGIKRINNDGSGNEILGTGFNDPNGVAIQVDGKILIADTGNDAIKRMNADGTGIVSLGSGFSGPVGVAVQADGKILVADYNNNAIKRITEEYTSNRVAVSVIVNTVSNLDITNPDAVVCMNKIQNLTATGGEINAGSQQVVWTANTTPASLYTDANATIPYTPGDFATTIYAKPTVPTIYTATATIGSCSKTDTVSFTTATSTWDGTEWLPTEPTGNTSLVINNNYTSTADIFGCDCAVNATNITVASGHTMSLVNELEVTNGNNIVFENNSSLLQENDAAVNTGNIKYKRTTPIIANDLDFVYLSSPVAGQEIKKIWMTTANDTFYSYDATIPNWAYAAPTTVMIPSVGYIARAVSGSSNSTSNNTSVFTAGSSWNAPFIGVPNNGNYTSSVSVTGGYVDNLLGNPYPSAIDLLALKADNPTVLEGIFYFWTHNSVYVPAANGNPGYYLAGDYTSYSTTTGNGTSANGNIVGSQYVAAGQSFFANVLPTVTTTNVNFKNSQRVAANNSGFYRSANATTSANTITNVANNSLWLNLTNTATSAMKQQIVGYAEGATNNYDLGYDAQTYYGFTPSDFYSVIPNYKFVQQYRNFAFSDSDVVPLGFTTISAGNYKISIDHTGSHDVSWYPGQRVYLQDNLLGIDFDLTTADYTFTTVAGTFDNRFVLKYTRALSTSNEDNLSNNVVVAKDKNVLKIKSTIEDISKVTIFDILGREVYTKSAINSKDFTDVNIVRNQQALIVKITLTNGAVVSKKIVY